MTTEQLSEALGSRSDAEIIEDRRCGPLGGTFEAMEMIAADNVGSSVRIYFAEGLKRPWRCDYYDDCSFTMSAEWAAETLPGLMKVMSDPDFCEGNTTEEDEMEAFEYRKART